MSMINGTRLYDHLTRLGRIGFVPKEGTTRLPYTPAYDEGRIYVQQEVRHLPAERLMKLCGQIWPSTDLQWSRSAPAEEI